MLFNFQYDKFKRKGRNDILEEWKKQCSVHNVMRNSIKPMNQKIALNISKVILCFGEN